MWRGKELVAILVARSKDEGSSARVTREERQRQLDLGSLRGGINHM